ncbi:type I secretion C-terminal target domain-containing protein [Mitsuaria sp. GD03876]|uniref:type I secretion C-terminal target domain-containing protein n=1 Tax=Mitsuaria sp. GD03876 TaxID=2975399 RepID=UPI002446D8D7|nr:type I secretion C-terminal target domain-containing protein [Mitsuaria sp. GD03876]MDH0867958.1 type I secretion C-terminal target domain-containing protein [Mitsuaria sp. GD03876]
MRQLPESPDPKITTSSAKADSTTDRVSRRTKHLGKRVEDDQASNLISQGNAPEAPATDVPRGVDEQPATAETPTTAQELASDAGLTNAGAGTVAQAAPALSGLNLAALGLGAAGLAGAAAAAGGGKSESAKPPSPIKPDEPKAPDGPGVPEPPTVDGGEAIKADGSVKVGGLESGGKWEFSTDGGKTWTPGNGDSIPAGSLAEGNNSVSIVQIDKSGNRSEPVVVTVVKDTVAEAPKVSTSSGAEAINASGSVKVGGLESGGKWEFSTDGGKTWNPGSGDSVPAGSLAEGNNSVSIVQIDKSGNRSEPVVVTVVKDTVAEAPKVSTSSGAEAINASGSVKVGGLESGGKWEFSTDGGKTWNPGSGDSVPAGSLAEGSNSISIVQIDKSGNRSEPVAINVVKDSVAPTKPSFTTTSANATVNGAGAVIVSGLESGGQWNFSVNGGAAKPGQGYTIAADQLTEGSNKITVTNKDAAGNESSTSFEVVKDSVAPNKPSFTTTSANATVNPAGAVTIGGLESGGQWSFSVNGGAATPGQGNTIAANHLVEGVNKITITSKDAAGNESSNSFEVIKDSVAPTKPTYTTSGSNATVNAAGAVTIGGLEYGGQWNFSVNGGVAKPGQGYTIAADQLTEGINKITITSKDAAGNESSNSFEVTKDSVAPTKPTYTTSGSNATVNAAGAVTIGGLESGGQWSFSVNGGAANPGQGNTIAANHLVEGINKITITSKDAAGNESSNSFEVTKDSVAPTKPTYTTSGSNATVNAAGAVTIGGLESGGQWSFSVNGGAATPGQGNTIAANHLVEGINKITVTNKDAAGNESSDSFEVTKDSVAPTKPTLVTSTGSDVLNATGQVSINGLESGATWQYSVNAGKTWQQGQGQALSASALAVGTSTLSVRQIDAAGNIGAETAMQVTRKAFVPLTVSLLNDTGSSAVDNVTSDPTLVVRGEPGAAFGLYLTNGNPGSLPATRLREEGMLVYPTSNGTVAARLYPEDKWGEMRYELRHGDGSPSQWLTVIWDKSKPLSATHAVGSAEFSVEPMRWDGSMIKGYGPSNISYTSTIQYRSLDAAVKNGSGGEISADGVFQMDGNAPASTGLFELRTINTAGTSQVVKYSDAGLQSFATVVMLQDGKVQKSHLVQGGAQADTLAATDQFDTMAGGRGADTFRWGAAARGMDLVLDYSKAEGDVLDLSQLLQGFQGANLGQFVQKEIRSDGYVRLLVDVQGAGDFAHAELTVLLAPPAGTDIQIRTSTGISVI